MFVYQFVFIYWKISDLYINQNLRNGETETLNEYVNCFFTLLILLSLYRLYLMIVGLPELYN